MLFDLTVRFFVEHVTREVLHGLCQAGVETLGISPFSNRTGRSCQLVEVTTAPARLYAAAVSIAVFVVSSVVLAGFVLEGHSATIVNDAAQLVAGLVATVCCWSTGRRTSGVERTWRILMAIGMAGWSVGQAVWSYYQIFAGVSIPSPSAADLGYLTLPVFAFMAMLSLAISANLRQVNAPRVLAARLGFSLLLMLDGLVVVGSMFIIAWATALGAASHAGAPTALEFGVALAYPLTDLVLATMVSLLLSAYRVAPPYRLQLSLLGVGLIAIATSDSVFTYAVSSGAEAIAPIYDAGFIAGPALIALAALATATFPPAGTAAVRTHAGSGSHIRLPYVLAAAGGVLIVAKVASGRSLDKVEIFAGLLVVCLAVVRQLIVLVELAAKRISEATAARAREAFRVAADHAVTAFERPVPPLEITLEDEIADISSTEVKAALRAARPGQRARAMPPARATRTRPTEPGLIAHLQHFYLPTYTINALVRFRANRTGRCTSIDRSLPAARTPHQAGVRFGEH